MFVALGFLVACNGSTDAPPTDGDTRPDGDAPALCQSDSDCEADSVCEAGQCISWADSRCGADDACLRDSDCQPTQICDDACDCAEIDPADGDKPDGDVPDGDADGDADSDGDDDGDISGPRLDVPEEIVFPYTPVGSELQKSLLLANTGDSPLQIESIDIQNPSGHHEFELVWENDGGPPFAIDSGFSTDLTIRYKPEDVWPDEVPLLIASNDPDHPVTTVKLVSMVNPCTVMATPEALAFGEKDLDNEPAVMTVRLTCEEPPESGVITQITGISLPENVVAFALPESVQDLTYYLSAGSGLNLDVYFLPQQKGEFASELTIEATYNTISVDLSGIGAAPDLFVYPLSDGAIDFQTVAINQQISYPLVLKNTGDGFLKIDRIALVDGNGAFDLQGVGGVLGDILLDSGEQAGVWVEFMPTAAQAYADVLRIESNAYGMTQLDIPISGEGADSGVPIEPSYLDFGNVKVGESRTKSFSIRNNSGQSLTISELSLQSVLGRFAIVAADQYINLAIAPNDSLDVSIVYQPDGEGQHNDMLSIHSDNATLPEIKIPLFGFGAEAHLQLRLNGEPNFTDTLDFGLVFLDDSRTRTLQLRNVGTWPLDATRLTLDDANGVFSLLPQLLPGIDPGQSVELAVSYTPTGDEAAIHNAQLEFENNAPESPLAITLTGQTSEPTLAVTPSPIVFDSTLAGTATDKTVILYNPAGNDNTPVFGIGIAPGSDPIFAIDAVEFPLPVELGGGQSFYVIVSAHPESTAVYQGALRIELGYTGSTAITVPMQATGSDCPAGSWNLDDDPSDCEYACDLSNGGVETCDNKDNDCNGLTDDGGYARLSCPPRDYADAACVAGQCVYSCNAGWHDCDGACVWSAGIQHCGAQCAPCPAPDFGTASCEPGGQDYVCGFTCLEGFTPMDGQCRLVGDVTCCGTGCATCPDEVSGGDPACIDGACSFICTGGFHRCGEVCVSNSHIDHCGASCEPCPAPTGGNGQPTCTAGVCGVACDPWYHLADGGCAENTTTDCCGLNCQNCGDAPINGSMTCSDYSCTFGCDPGFHRCNERCVGNRDVNHCGLRCDPCPVPAHGAATCDGTACGFVCDDGYHRDGNLCAPNDSADCCGLNCTRCVAPDDAQSVCTAGACAFICNAGFHVEGERCVANGQIDCCGTECVDCGDAPANGRIWCDGSQCRSACNAGYHDCDDMCAPNDAVETCGSRCTPCLAPDNATATCDGVYCDWYCNAGFHRSGASCLANTTPEHCGDGDLHCTAPDNAEALCTEAGSCGFVCLQGYHRCGDVCVTDHDIGHCGTLCEPCQPPANAAASCDGAVCSWECLDGYHVDGNSCAPNVDTTCCGPDCSNCANAPANGEVACIDGVCDFVCDPGFHRCGEQCWLNTDVLSCGPNCSPCPDPPLAEPTCDGSSCGFVCVTGARLENGQCVLNDDDDCCGPSCVNCGDGPQNGFAYCGQNALNNWVCLSDCDPDFHFCGEACVSDDDVAHCGASCYPCAEPANATALCHEESCDFTCAVGYHKQGLECVPNAQDHCCGDDCVSCIENLPQYGDGACVDGQCTLGCISGYHLCTDTCLADTHIDSCGDNCSPCPTYANGTSICDNGACGVVCNMGFHYDTASPGNPCQPNDDSDCCGDDCTVCDSVAHAASVFCDDGQCSFACETGYHRAGSQCLPNTDDTICGDSAENCTLLPTDPAYDFAIGFCDTSGAPVCAYDCEDGWRRCDNADGCFEQDSLTHCGPDCLACPGDPANGQMQCIADACTIVCNEGFVLVGDVCEDTSIDPPVCCGEDCTEPFCEVPVGFAGYGACIADGGDGHCEYFCYANNHLCPDAEGPGGASCLSNQSPDSCGTRCEPCPQPDNSTASCNNNVCSFSCNPGYHRAGSLCVANDSPDCCGEACTYCSWVPFSQPACNNGVCELHCDSGYHLCEGLCVSDASVNSCGDLCSPCTAPAHASPVCSAGTCDFTCFRGYHREGDACLLNEAADCCGPDCVTCSGPADSEPYCTDGRCDWTCIAGTHECSDACVNDDSPNHCGSRCTPCPAVANAEATCENGTCGWQCREGYHDYDGLESNGCEGYCLPSGEEDLPDDNFSDANCDGIDGQANRAVFLASDGSDANPGTMDSPKRSLAAAVELASASTPKKYVIVSNGFYYERVVVQNGVSIYGGYVRYDNWQRSATVKPQFIATSAIGGEAVRIDEPTRIDRISITASRNIRPTGFGNSVGMYVEDSDDALMFTNCRFKAVNARDGAAGSNGVAGQHATAGQSGSRPGGGIGGWGYCGSQTLGGAGGSGGRGGVDGTRGQGSCGGAGGSHGEIDWWFILYDCCEGVSSGGNGCNGSNGASGADGQSAQEMTTPIELAYESDSGLWLLAGRAGLAGNDGSWGIAGSGGGGGGGCQSSDLIGLIGLCPSGTAGGGGGGGGAGCGGTSGGGGTAGGSSLGMLLYNASPIIIGCAVESGEGGDGGNGGLGGAGGLGAGGGSGIAGFDGAAGGGNGGRGGDGGNGGHGGGGAGGMSFGIYRAGTSDPDLADINYTVGDGGSFGNSGGAIRADSGELY